MINVALIGNWGAAGELLLILDGHPSFCVKFVLTQYSDIKKDDCWFNMVWDYSLDNNIPVFLQDDFRNNDDKFVKLLERESVDLIVSCAYPFLIRKKVIDFMESKFGIVNLHGSVLPKYRGTTPVLWAIINNDEYLGITLHYIDEGCDSGDIIYQSTIKNSLTESLYDLTERLKYAGSHIFSKYLDDLSSGKEIKRIVQDSDKSCVAPRIKGKLLKMNFNQSVVAIRSFFKATQNLNPYFECKGEKYIVKNIGQIFITKHIDVARIKYISNTSILISSKGFDIEIFTVNTTMLSIGDIIN
jgi:methionyl-tRNA formyltransferase